MSSKRISFSRIVFGVWILVWVLFLVRPYWAAGLGQTYRNLLGASAEERRSYSVGRELFEFIRFAQQYLPADVPYQIAGLQDGSLALRHLLYYLYPHRRENNAEYLLVYHAQDFYDPAYLHYASLDNERYILKRKVP